MFEETGDEQRLVEPRYLDMFTCFHHEGNHTALSISCLSDVFLNEAELFARVNFYTLVASSHHATKIDRKH
jgi:hypothetical protein